MRYGVLGRAVGRGLLTLGTEDPRSHTRDAHRTVDDRPYGGGPGMVLKPEPLCAAIAAASARVLPGSQRIALSAQGEPLTQARVAALARCRGWCWSPGAMRASMSACSSSRSTSSSRSGIMCSRAGNSPALALVDALARLLPGALGDERSSVEESFGEGLLEWPHYTRPEVFEGRRVPAVLSSGDHAAIRRWRLKQSIGRTWLRRPDLIGSARRSMPSDAASAGRIFAGAARRRARDVRSNRP